MGHISKIAIDLICVFKYSIIFSFQSGVSILRIRKIPISNPKIGLEAVWQVSRVLLSGKLAQGKKVEEFESAFSRLVMGRDCIAVNSGTSALHVSLLALGIGEGDEVIVPAFTFAATANVVRLCGATPIFVDIDLDSFTISLPEIQAAINANTRAIIPVHLYGRAANMTQISELASRHGLYIIEDAAQAHGAETENGQVGTLGELACFSFYATKNLSTGEGGMVVSSNPELTRKIRMLRNQGMIERYKNEIPGYNYRMTEFQAAIGLVHLKKLNYFTRLRIQNASIFEKFITAEEIVKPTIGPGKHVFHQYTLLVPEHSRNELRGFLSTNGVESEVYYPEPVPALKTFSVETRFPKSEAASRRVLSIPVHPKVTRRQAKFISDLLNSFFRT